MYLSTSIGSPSQTIGGNHPNPPSLGSNTTFVLLFFFSFLSILCSFSSEARTDGES